LNWLFKTFLKAYTLWIESNRPQNSNAKLQNNTFSIGQQIK